MLRLRHRLLANIYYLKRPFLRFLPLLLLLTLLLVLGGFAFQHLYKKDPPGYVEGLYLTYCLVFMEWIRPFPEHAVLRILYFLLPPLGLVVVLDGLVRFGYHVLRRDANSKEWIQ